MTELQAPSQDLAEKLLAELERYEDRLSGWKTGATTGSTATDLYSLREAVDFLQMSDPARLLQKGGHAFIGYLDLEELQRWVGETLGDADLAAAIGELIAAGSSYAERIAPVRVVMEDRLVQAQEALA